jgi:hypothetical protein
VEVEKTMFKVITYPLDLIFYLLTIRNGDVRDVEKEKFHVVA